MEPVGDWLAGLTFFGALTFVLIYGVFAPWYRTPLGRNVMVLMGVIALAAGLATVTIVFGFEFPARAVIRAVIWGLICVTVWWRVWILVRTQVLARRSGRKREGERDG